MSLMDLDPQQLLLIGLVIALVVISLSLHEYCHALVALWCGDSTARDLGRLTPDPRAHVDPFMTILLPAILYFTAGIIFGGAKPVPVSYHRLRHPARDMMFVAIAGPLCNIVLALLFALILKILVETGFYELAYPLAQSDVGARALAIAVYANVILALFNLLPVPPLDGSRVMAYLLPAGLRDSYHNLERYGMLILFALFFSGLVGRVIGPILVDVLRGIGSLFDLPWQLFISLG